jgi:DNA-binding transcriptional MerR regulator
MDGKKMLPTITKSIPMRELERLTGITRMTINFYIKEGLLPQPRKTAKNMAYYDQAFIDRLQLILKLKTQNHLSLSQIKGMLQNLTEVAEAGLHLDVRDRVFGMVSGNHEQNPVTWEELVKQTGLNEDLLRQMQDLRLIYPEIGDADGIPHYHYDSVVMGKIVKKIMELNISFSEIKSVAAAIHQLSSIETNIYQHHLPTEAMNDQFAEEWKKVVELSSSFTSLVHLHDVYELLE